MKTSTVTVASGAPNTARMKTLGQQPTTDEILRRLRQLRPDSPRRWGRMTAHQMVCHLSDCFRMTTGEKRVSDATGVFQRTVVKWIALYIPAPWPAGILTRPEIDQHVGGTSPVDFSADVAELEALTELFIARDPDSNWPPHPIFGRMSRTAWLRWGYRHMDHHLRQFGV
jgi:hypothetical protein